MRLLKQIVAATVWVLTAQSATADSLVDQVGVNYQRGSWGYTSQKVFGTACYAMRYERENPTCAASNLAEAENTETYFGINVTSAYDSTVFSQSQDAIKGQDKVRLAQSLLANQSERRFEADSQIWWRSDNWALVLQPGRWTYYSSVQNSAYPALQIHVMQEQSLSYFVGGLPKSLGSDSGWRMGLQTRVLKRQLVQERFNLFDAIPNAENYFQVKTQNQLLFEPSLSYLLDSANRTGLHPLLTLQAQNIGFTDRKLEETPMTPIANLGLSIQPEMGEDKFEFGMGYSFDEKLWQDRRLRFSAQYLWEQVVLAGGYDTREIALGVFTRQSPIKGGISWKNTQSPDGLGSISVDRSWQIEFGLVF